MGASSLSQGPPERGEESEWGPQASDHPKAVGGQEAGKGKVLRPVLQGGETLAAVQVQTTTNTRYGK